VNLAGLVFAFEANSKYVIEIYGLAIAAAATTGFGFALDVDVAVTTLALSFFHQLANTGTVTGGSSIADAQGTGVSSGFPASGPPPFVPILGGGVLITGASPGTAQLQFRAEVAAVATCKAGTILRVRKLP